MRLMLTAERTEFLEFDPLRRGALVFRFAVIPVFAFAALERNDFSWHFLPLAHPEL